jgi:hypothetical protein
VAVDGHVGVEAGDELGGGVDFRPADVVVAVDDLSLEVAPLDPVGVGDAETTHAGGGEILDDRRTEPAGTDHEDARGKQRSLSVRADVVHDDVPGVAVELFGIEIRAAHWWPYAGSSKKQPGPRARRGTRPLSRLPVPPFARGRRRARRPPR